MTSSVNFPAVDPVAVVMKASSARMAVQAASTVPSGPAAIQPLSELSKPS